MSWPYPRILGHRGGGSLAPENTLAGFTVAARSGIAGVEFDVMLSKAGTPYVIHDETLDRTTNATGTVADSDDAFLDRLDAGAWFGPGFTGEPVPRFGAAAQRLRDLGLWCNVEIKPSIGRERETGLCVAAAAATLWRDAPMPPLLSSFSRVALAAARETAPQLPRGMLVGELPADWQERLLALDCVALHFDAAKVAMHEVEGLCSCGWWLVAYTVNEVDQARALLAAGVDAVITDRIDLLSNCVLDS